MGWGMRAVFTAAFLLTCTTAALAQDRREFDRKIEVWAARQVSGKLGELRGPFASDTSIGFVTVHEALSQPPPEPPPAPPPLEEPTVASPPAGPTLPPIVMNQVIARRENG
jgi:hypothetical protein